MVFTSAQAQGNEQHDCVRNEQMHEAAIRHKRSQKTGRETAATRVFLKTEYRGAEAHQMLVPGGESGETRKA
jgi:hypothetical protein